MQERQQISIKGGTREERGSNEGATELFCIEVARYDSRVIFSVPYQFLAI